MSWIRAVGEAVLFFILSAFSTFIFGVFFVGPPLAACAWGAQYLLLWPFGIYAGVRLFNDIKDDYDSSTPTQAA